MAERKNFGDLPANLSRYQLSEIVVLPICYDRTSTWLKGADKGPDAIIDASAHLELYDIETDSRPCDKGIFTAKPLKEKCRPKVLAETVETAVGKYISDGKFIATIGGEHSVSIGAIKAHSDKYNDLTVLQLDAHSDLRDEYEGSRYNHACVMARAREHSPIVQVGIRSMALCEKESMDSKNVFFAKDIHDSTGWIGRAVPRLSDNVYITLDLDVFDTSIMPSTGTPEPGGMGWYDVLGFLKAVCETKKVVGFDVVELCPDKNNRAPDFLAAKLIYKLLAYGNL